VLARKSEDVERREMCRLPARFHIELRADASGEFRGAALGRKHSAEKKQIARLDGLCISAERFRRRRQLDAQCLQSLLGAD